MSASPRTGRCTRAGIRRRRRSRPAPRRGTRTGRHSRGGLGAVERGVWHVARHERFRRRLFGTVVDEPPGRSSSRAASAHQPGQRPRDYQFAHAVHEAAGRVLRPSSTDAGTMDRQRRGSAGASPSPIRFGVILACPGSAGKLPSHALPTAPGHFLSIPPPPLVETLWQGPVVPIIPVVRGGCGSGKPLEVPLLGLVLPAPRRSGPLSADPTTTAPDNRRSRASRRPQGTAVDRNGPGLCSR